MRGGVHRGGAESAEDFYGGGFLNIRIVNRMQQATGVGFATEGTECGVNAGSGSYYTPLCYDPHRVLCASSAAAAVKLADLKY